MNQHIEALDEVGSRITISIDRSQLLRKQGNHTEIIMATERLKQLKKVVVIGIFYFYFYF